MIKPFYNNNRFFLVFVCLFLCITVSAQNYQVKYLDISSGLSNNSVTSVYQDRNGYLWFGTFDGLNKYDGYDFKVFRNDAADDYSLPNNYIHCLDGDDKDNIWIGGSNGASIYSQEWSAFFALRYVTDKKGTSRLLKDAVQKIVNFKNKDFTLLATQKSGLLIYRSGSHTGTVIPITDEKKIYTAYNATAIAYVSGKDFCYVFVNNLGLCKYMFKARSLQVVNRQLTEANCLEVHLGGIWAGTDEGVFLYNEAANTFSHNYLPEKELVRSLLPDTKSLLIATDGAGIFKLDNNAAVAVSYNYSGDAPIVRSNAVWSLYKDTKGRKWFGTLRGGISLMGSEPLHFENHRYKTAVANYNQAENFILSFCEDQNQNLWIGTDGGGMRYWDRKKDVYTNYTSTSSGSKKIPSNFVTSIVKDDTNAVWLSMWGGGISCIDSQTGTIKHFSCYNPFKKKEDKDIWVLFIDSHKNLWAGASNNGALYRFDKKSNSFKVFKNGLTDIKCLYETKDGKIWGGNANAIIAIDPVLNTYKQYETGFTVRCVVEDKRKQLWVGTADGGLLLFDRKTKSYRKFTTANGLPSNTILRLLEDKTVNLWMSTYNGISRFDPDKMTFRNFSASDGLQSNQFNFNAGLELSSGEFIFGGINGFNIFRPEQIQDHKKNSNVLLNELFVDNAPLRKNSSYITEKASGTIKSIRLPFDKSTLSLDFVSLDFAHQDKINYAYLLEGWDSKWNFTGKNRKANYSRLHEGTYVFKVKTTNDFGKWTTATTLLTITILPPWYRTWWAYSFYFVLLAGTVYLYIRYNAYKERLRYEVQLAHIQNSKEKELWDKQLSMFTFIAHELRTPLSLIINPLKRAVNPKNDTEDTIDFTIAYRNARRLLSLTDQLLLFRKAEDDADELNLSAIDLNSLCNEIYQCFVYQAKEQRIAYTFTSIPAKTEVLGDYEKLEIALFNLVSNAFKYTPPGGTITIALHEKQSEFFIEITDTGRGISADDLGHVFEKFKQGNAKNSSGSGFGIGLYVTKYFITKHHGAVTCSSVVAQGSTFTVMLLKGYDHFADMPVTTANSKMSELVEELLADTTAVNHALSGAAGDTEFTAVEVLQNGGMSDRKSILIVEDNIEIRNYLIQLFTKIYHVYSAANGEYGFELTQKHLPDIVLSDITMESMSGLDLCKKIKQSDRLSHIPVVLLTATRNSETHLQGITEGADDYITKPFDNDILLARIESLLRNRSLLNKYFLDSITLSESNYKIPAEYKEFLSRCIEIVESNLDNKEFSLKTLSAAIGMSHSGLYKKIKAISGQTVNSFIRSIRLRRAAVILLTESVNIAQSGYLVGIDDPRYFREQFVKLFGMTPSEYRKKYKNSYNKELNIIQQ